MTYDLEKVTPRPWVNGGNAIYSDGATVAKTTATVARNIDGTTTEADVAHIVHCVNHHEALVDALAWYQHKMDKIQEIMRQCVEPPTIPDVTAVGEMLGITDNAEVVEQEKKYRALLEKVKS